MSSSLNMAAELLALARAASEDGRRSEAVRLLNQLLGMRDLPDDVVEQGHCLLGELHVADGRYGAARRHLTVVVVRNDESAQAHFLLGRALDWDEQDGDDDEALFHYQRAVELAPDAAPFRSAYGLLLTYMGRQEDGAEHLWAACRQAPDNLELLYNLCVGMINGGELEGAGEVVARVLARHPDDTSFQHLQRELDRLASEPPEMDVVEAPDEEPVVTSIEATRREQDWRRRQDAKPLSPKTGLATALSRVPSHWVKAMGAALGLEPASTASQGRAELVEHLTRADVLEEVVRQLPVPSRQALERVAGRKGWMDAEELAGSFPASAPDGWWWEQQPPASPIGRLRLVGLLFIGTSHSGGHEQIIAVIPRDLRDAVRQALRSP